MGLNLLPTIKVSFQKYLTTGARSNEKLKILHAKIANDLQDLLGKSYIVESLGVGTGKEKKIDGRYIDKVVDITISKINGEIVGGVAVKFVMSNYSQNSNNYFENMLGETANIRSANIPYFQIFIIPEEIPYYDNSGTIKKAEKFSAHNVEKYVKLSEDNPNTLLHTPDKTLLMVVALPKLDITKITNRTKYVKAYTGADIKQSSVISNTFKSSVILNNYDEFMTKVAYRIRAV
ncbi:MAG: hypothetical protein LBB23_00685 [Rickettsiales bacterium]|jgi:hypothetical protein|nr:hypothetical protein [Rickettsiales bacterium]